jgi:hypothetical protein
MNNAAFIPVAILTLAAAQRQPVAAGARCAGFRSGLGRPPRRSSFARREFVGLVLVFIYIGAVAVLIVFRFFARRDVGKDRGFNW